MNRLTSARLIAFLGASLITLPLIASAQTANTPGGQASTGSALDQTTGDPAKTTPKTTATSPDATNPGGQTNKSKHPAHAPKAAAAPSGDVPTYPAPAKDGTPTR